MGAPNAAATAGLDGLTHMPKGIGLLSMIPAAGIPQAITLAAGGTTSGVGAAPKEH
jgi:hypothetical protein